MVTHSVPAAADAAGLPRRGVVRYVVVPQTNTGAGGPSTAGGRLDAGDQRGIGPVVHRHRGAAAAVVALAAGGILTSDVRPTGRRNGGARWGGVTNGPGPCSTPC